MTTDLISRNDIFDLVDQRNGPCVSLFMHTHRTAAEMEQDKVRFKNLVRKAEEQLKSQGFRRPGDILGSAHDLESDNNFWNYQSDGLAMFLSDGFIQYYRLPISFKELLFVNDRFHVKPLIPMLSEDGRYCILALSQSEVRFLECTRHTVQERELEGIPASKDEANKHVETDKGFQYSPRTISPALTGGQNGGGANFHGHGTSPREDNKDRIRRFFQQIDKGLHRLLMDQSAPLVLAGVDYLHPLYRETNHYPHLVEKGIIGNPEMWRPEELNAQAWPLVESIFAKSREQAEEKYMQLLGSHKASNDIKEVVRAAYQGRVDVLMVATDIQQWGVYDLSSDRVEVHLEKEPGDDDLLDYVTVQTLKKDGTVYAIKPHRMPLETPVAALFRF